MADIWLPSDGNVQVFIDKHGVLSVTERVDMSMRPMASQFGFMSAEEVEDRERQLKRFPSA
jgi:hypothetical protein